METDSHTQKHTDSCQSGELGGLSENDEGIKQKIKYNKNSQTQTVVW